MDPLRGSEPLIPGYRLVGRLGSGGFGTVYAAEDSSGRSVAIKVLRPELSDDKELLSRLEREAVALRQVTGDHTATILEVNTRGEHAYLVMDLIEGQNLEEYVRSKGPLKGFELRVVVEELVAALGEIHRAGVIHRDLKPSNVMYGPAGVTLLDFGISSLADSTALTKSGAFIGTAGWISPEQIEGRPVSTATDVFNLGLVIAYAATGLHPFGTGRPEGIMYRICHHYPEVSGVPEPIQGLVRECLNRDENARVGIAEIARVIESDFGASWEPAEEPVEEPGIEGVASTRRISRRASPAGSTIRVGVGKLPSDRGVSVQRKSKKGLFALASIVLVAAVAAAIAITTSRPEPAANQTEPMVSTQTEETENPTTTEATTSTTGSGEPPEVERTEESSDVPSESVAPVAAVTERPSVTVSPVPSAPASTQTPKTTQVSVPGAIDGAPRASDFKGNSVDLGVDFEVISVSYVLTDSDGVRSSSLRMRRSDGTLVAGCPSQSSRIAGSQLSGSWRADCVIRDLQPSSSYTRYYYFEHCSTDVFGSQNCSALGTSRVSYGNAATTSTSKPPAESPGDTNDPVLVSSSVNPNPVNAGDQISITWRLTDESGVTFTTAFVRNPSGGPLSCGGGPASRISGSALDGTYRQTCVIPASAAGGTYVVQIQAEEPNGNLLFVSQATTFTVSGGSGDTNDPVLVSSSVNPNPVNAGDQISITWRLTDESGVTFTTAFVRNPSGGPLSCGGGPASRISGSALDGTYRQTCVIPASAAGGTYVVQIQAEEPNGNLLFVSQATTFTVSGGL